MRTSLLFKSLIPIFLFLTCAEFKAQSLANYSSVRNTGISYGSISGSGSSIPSWRNISTFTEDDNRSDFINIGFDFWYFGVRYTQFSVSSNGFIDFSTSTDDGGPLADDFGYYNPSFTNTSPSLGTWPAIAAFYDDLTAQGAGASLATSVKYAVTGSAPSRTLTIEWINMGVSTNTTTSLNFQAMLVETTGQILVNYSTMNNGTFTFSYSMGLNVDGNPTPARLKMLQTENTNAFSNNQENNLSAMPAANSQYIFTPPVPTAAPGSLSFSALTSGGMTVNWTNLATNEIGYVLYNSTDGINYSFVTQTAQNATSAIITGLNPNTLYYWRVYAVTEGCLNTTPLSGSQTTLPGQNKISVASGNWNTAATWSPTGVPTPGDNATISNGHVVSIDVNASCNMLTVGTGGAATLQYLGSTPRSLNTYSNVTINNGATFNVNTSSNVTHSLIIRGNIINNGTFNMATDLNSLCNTTITATSSKSLSGTGATTRLNNLRMNVGAAPSDIFEISTPSFTAPVNFLIIDNGTFKLSVTNPATLTPVTVAATLGPKHGFWLNSPNVTVNTGAGITASGSLTISNGTINIGNAADEDLTVNGGTVTLVAGALNVAGKFFTPTGSSACIYSQNGGTVTVAGFGSSNAVFAPFNITGAGSSFNVTGGAIILAREGGSGAQDLGMINTSASGSVSGGTLQIGNASTPGSQIISINTNKSIGNLSINSANATARLVTNTVNIIGSVNISAGSFNANNLDITLGGNWISAGTTFTPGTAMVTFSSNAAQSVSRTGGETFNNLLFAGSGTKTFGSNITCSGSFSINSGSTVDVSASNYTLNVAGNFNNNGTFNPRYGLVMLNGSSAQSINSSLISEFYNLSLNNTSGATMNNDINLIGALTLSNGVFNINGKNLTMVSTATATARIAEITGTGDISGNVIVQRYAPPGLTGWAFLATPITSGLTLNDWDDDIYISCATCPDGSAGGFISIYTYDETAIGTKDDISAYIPMSTINDPITPGKGYWVYLGTGSVSTTPITLDVVGTVRKFNYTLPLNYTNYGSAIDDGWNLIHNPYPSPIKWSALRGTTPNIDNAIYVWNADLDGYASYVNGVSSPAYSPGGSGLSDTIPMCQGFYVHSTGATALSAQESNKVGGIASFLKTSETAQTAASAPLLRLYLDKTGSKRDEAVLYVQSGATDFFDAEYDAYKLPGNDPAAPTIATEKGNKSFQINGVSPIAGNFSIPLKTLTGYSGSYTITADNINSFPAGACFTLYDKFTGITTNLKTSSYIFNLADTTSIARFVLNITLNPLTITSNVSQPDCSAPASGEITAKGTNTGPWNYYWKDSGGNPIKISLNKANTDSLKNLSSGTIYLEVNTVGMCDNNTSSFIVNPVDITVSQFICADTVDLGTGGVANFNNTSLNSVSYLWDFGDGSGNSSAAAPTHVYNTAGTYTVSLLCTSTSGCTDTSYKQIIVLDKFVGIVSHTAPTNDFLVKTIGDNEFVIQKSMKKISNVSFKLMDAFGKQVKDYGIITSDNINLHLDLNHLATGIYFLNISDESEKTVVKLPVK